MEDKKERIFIAYTDGSAEPNPGPCGGSMHGYVYEEFADKQKDAPTGVVITNMGYLSKINSNNFNYKIVNPVLYLDGVYTYSGIGTNNIGELIGVLETLKYVLKNNDELKIDKIVFYTDSTYTINAYRNIMTSDEKKWNKPDKPNIEILREINIYLKKADFYNLVIDFVKVKGHSNDFGNDIADRLAWVARNTSSNNEVFIDVLVSDGKKYWKPKIERESVLKFKNIYYLPFIRGKERSKFYGVIDYKSDEVVGKKTNNALYGVVKLKELPEIVENVMNYIADYLKNFSMVTEVSLKDIYTSQHMRYHNFLKEKAYKFYSGKGYKYLYLDETPIIQTVENHGLGTLAFQKIKELNTVLEKYEQNEIKPNQEVIDITDYIFDVDDKTTMKLDTLSKNIIVDINIDGKVYKVPIILGKEMLSRNQLKSLEKEEPEIKMIIEKVSEKFFKYYIVIETLEFSSIWSGVYTSGYYM